MTTSLGSHQLDRNLLDLLSSPAATSDLGTPEARQPVHTVYGGAHLFKANTAARFGELALASLREHASDSASLARALGFDELLSTVYSRIVEKLNREPVEDFRIDFEDGYGHRPDAEEDGHAVQAALEVARGLEQGSLPPQIGIRIKPINRPLHQRSLRTLDLFITALAERVGSDCKRFIVTLPKVTRPEPVSALVGILGSLESKVGLSPGTLQVELMVETTSALFAADGTLALPKLVAAAQGRCVGAHFGPYDYTAACGITAAHQQLKHPACDFARHVMQVSLTGTGVALSDGPTTVIPVGPHRALKQGPGLTVHQLEENRAVVYRAWRLAYENTWHSLVNGFYQGWDLHPAQLPVRYAAVYTFFLQGLDSAARRLRSFIEQAAQATLLGDVFDDAATGQGLVNYFLRAINCGALTAEEAHRVVGLSVDELRTRSFATILAGRTT